MSGQPGKTLRISDSEEVVKQPAVLKTIKELSEDVHNLWWAITKLKARIERIRQPLSELQEKVRSLEKKK
jgi:uncharacterized coiled-coil protein SlyX